MRTIETVRQGNRKFRKFLEAHEWTTPEAIAEAIRKAGPEPA
jgi:hypothetical protein